MKKEGNSAHSFDQCLLTLKEKPLVPIYNNSSCIHLCSFMGQYRMQVVGGSKFMKHWLSAGSLRYLAEFQLGDLIIKVPYYLGFV